jgi:hypothetical protein
MEKNIVYEVNLEINEEVYESYMEFLKVHVGDMLKFEGFISAKIFTRNPKNENDTYSFENPKLVTCQYVLKSIEHLENYIQNNSAKMRDEAIKLFGSNFKAKRRVLELFENFQ